MNILIFGATGGTGRELIAECLARGYRVTAFVRNPDALQLKNENFSIYHGNALSLDDVTVATKNQDVVISVLGNKTSDALWKSNTIISDAVRNIISGMKNNNVKRLLFVGSFGVNDNIFWPERLLLRTVLWNLFADIPKQEGLIKGSGLDFTIIHPARLINAPKISKYRTGVDLPIGLSSKIARSDVADFIVKNIQNESLIGKTITISY